MYYFGPEAASTRAAPTSNSSLMKLYRERIFPLFVDRLFGGKELDEVRRQLVDKAAGHVLEVGAGTGANFLCYSSAITSLTTVEPNPGMNRRARPKIRYLDFPVDTREISCDALPMKEASFDCAVATFTLCSLRNVEQCLGEIYRVLRPGGRLLYLGHGLSDSPSLRRWQNRLSPLRRCLCDGCHLDRDIHGLIREAGFELEDFDNYSLKQLPPFLGTVYEGSATK